jgi:hypothetical protein
LAQIKKDALVTGSIPRVMIKKKLLVSPTWPRSMWRGTRRRPKPVGQKKEEEEEEDDPVQRRPAG